MARHRRPRGHNLDELLEELDGENPADALLELLPPAVAAEIRLGTPVSLTSEDAGFAKVWIVELDRGTWKQRHRLGYSRSFAAEAAVRDTFEVGFLRFMALASGGKLDPAAAKRFVGAALSRRTSLVERDAGGRLEVVPIRPGIRGHSADVVTVDDVETARRVFGGEDDEGDR